MRLALVVCILVCSQRGFADPPADPVPGSGSDVAPTPPGATTPTTPWVDLAPASVLPQPIDAAPVERHNIAAPLTLGGMYVVFACWMYIAWYQHHMPLAQYKL